MSGVSTRVTIVNKKGLHARASGVFARLAGTFSSEIIVIHAGERANGTHIMDLLMLTAHKGSEIDIEAKGTDQDRALAALVSLVQDGFGELKDE